MLLKLFLRVASTFSLCLAISACWVASLARSLHLVTRTITQDVRIVGVATRRRAMMAIRANIASPCSCRFWKWASSKEAQEILSTTLAKTMLAGRDAMFDSRRLDRQSLKFLMVAFLTKTECVSKSETTFCLSSSLTSNSCVSATVARAQRSICRKAGDPARMRCLLSEDLGVSPTTLIAAS